jgi:hypothetical protein
MWRWLVCAGIFSGALFPSFAHDKFLSDGKPTSLVIAKYERLVEIGALLTPDGWKAVSALFASSQPYPVNGKIFLMSTGGALGENWARENTAEVETKWTDYFGNIGADLKYTPPAAPHVTMTVYQFQLQLTTKHQDLDSRGRLISERTGPLQWKIEGPLKVRWATPRGALAYVIKMHDTTEDPVLRKNAERTILILKKLQKPCGKSSAC